MSPLPAVLARGQRGVRQARLEVAARAPRRSGRRRKPAVEAVVALTSYPARIDAVALTVRSLLNQSVEPVETLLVLSQDEFPHRALPASLVGLEDRGLTVMWVEGNQRSYKKLLPVLADRDVPIVTADDDVLYGRHWLRTLVQSHRADPHAVWGCRGTEIVGLEGVLAPYVQWPPASSTSDVRRTFLTGMGGILYPPGALHEDVRDYDLAQRLCPTADDIWFKAMALRRGTATRLVPGGYKLFAPSRASSQGAALYLENVALAANDRQMDAVVEHFALWGELGVSR